MRALGAYIFQGGFTLGVARYFKIAAHFEEGPFGVATVEKNFGNFPIFQDAKTWPVSEYSGSIDYMFANPPCAPWSNAGSRVGRISWEKNPLTACWRRTAELVWQLQPKIAHIESVRPLYTKGRSMLSEIAAEARRQGYSVYCLLENAIDCNLPQRRPRFVLCLSKYAYQATPTGGEDVTPRMILKSLAAAGQPKENRRAAAAILGQNCEAAVLRHTPPGGRLARHFHDAFPRARKNKDGIFKGRPSMLKYRLHMDEPSPTQPGGPILFHPKELRYLTIGEAAALCGYPPGYEFVGSISSCYAQMGKAVLPPVGEHLAHDALRTLKMKAKQGNPKIAREIVIGRSTIETKEIDL